jgi:hypothetical protein
MSWLSRVFHVARSEAEGAVPIRPGWEMPAKRTPGMCRDVAYMPLKSQMALAALLLNSRAVVVVSRGERYRTRRLSYQRDHPHSPTQISPTQAHINPHSRTSTKMLTVYPHGIFSNGVTITHGKST